MDAQAVVAQNGLDAWYFDIPVVSRVYLTMVTLVTVACQLKMMTNYHLFLSWPLVLKARQYWRLVTTFLYFGDFGVDFIFHMFFLMRYCRMLEEGSFRGRTADFVWMMLIGSGSMLAISYYFDKKGQIPFLSSSLTFMITYLWCRRNAGIRINFLGLFNFDAPYLPWVLIAFTLVLHGVVPYADLLGLVVGHTYYYLEDVYPRLPGSHGHRPMAAPDALVALMGGRVRQAAVDAEPLAAGLQEDDLVDDAGSDDGAAPGGYSFNEPQQQLRARRVPGAVEAD